jgi:hypothetical protein
MAKLNYCWRTIHPDILSGADGLMDRVIEDALRVIIVANGPGFGDFQLQLVSLPIRLGGLGISLSSDLLHYAYLASQLSTLKLQHQMFPNLSNHAVYLQPLIQRFKHLVNSDEEFILPQQQHLLAKMYFERKANNLKSHPCRLTNEYVSFKVQQDTILESAKLQPSSHWKMALPNEGMNQKMNAKQYRAVLQFHLLMKILPEQRPCKCGGVMDCFGYHILACGGAGNTRTARHNTIVSSLVQLARLSGFHAVKDPPIIIPWVTNKNIAVNLRPADLSIVGDSMKTACVDVTLISSLCPSHIGAVANPGKAVLESAKLKINKHQEACRSQSLEFIPFAVDVCGVHDDTAKELLSRFATAYHARSSKPFSMCMSICYRRISFAIQTAVANQLTMLIYASRWI